MPISDYNRMCALDNLKRAYRWVLSNPEALYKNHFRDSYEAYAASSELNLNNSTRLFLLAFANLYKSFLITCPIIMVIFIHRS